jgi:hypothetical protein
MWPVWNWCGYHCQGWNRRRLRHGQLDGTNTPHINYCIWETKLISRRKYSTNRFRTRKSLLDMCGVAQKLGGAQYTCIMEWISSCFSDSFVRIEQSNWSSTRPAVSHCIYRSASSRLIELMKKKLCAPSYGVNSWLTISWQNTFLF